MKHLNHVASNADQYLPTLAAAARLDDLNVPLSNRLEKLQGDRAAQMSIRINDQHHSCFRWHDGNAYEVEITDSH